MQDAKLSSVNFNTHDFLKLIAIITMIVDHVGMYFYPKIALLRTIGRIAAPIFFFLVGYTQSTRLPISLIIYASILTGFSFLLKGTLYLNMLFMIVILRLGFMVFDFSKSPLPVKCLIFFILIFLGNTKIPFYLEYFPAGALIALAATMIRQNNWMSYVFTMASMIYYFINMDTRFQIWHSTKLIIILSIICCTLALVFTQFNRKVELPFLNGLRWIARNSLHIYFWHLLIFNCIFIWITFSSV